MQKRQIQRRERVVLCGALCLMVVVLLSYLEGAAQTSPVSTQSASACQPPNDDASCKVKDGEFAQPLSPADAPMDRQINGGERHLYKLRLPVSQFVQVIVEQTGIDVALTLCTLDGHRVAAVDRQSGSFGPEKLSFIPATDGDYILQVKPLLDTTLAGAYSVHIAPFRKVEPSDEVRVKAERVVTEGGAYYDLGRPECLRESIVKYKEAENLWQSLNDAYELAVTLYGLGWSYSKLGSYGMVKFPTPQHTLRWSYESREDHQVALNYFEHALSMMTAQNDRHGEAITLAGLAWPQLYLGRTVEALSSFSEAGKIFHSLNNKRGEAISEYGRGWAYALLNDNNSALNSYLHALSLRREAGDKKGGPPTLAAISRIYSRLGNYQEAIDYDRRAIEVYKDLKDPRGQASTWADLGWVYLTLGQYGRALDCFHESLNQPHGLDETGRANVLYGMARVESMGGNLSEALLAMERVREIIEPLRDKGTISDLRTYYSANVQEYYEFYINLLMRMHSEHPAAGYDARALTISEKARARELLTVLAQSDSTDDHSYDLVLGSPVETSDIQKILDPNTLLLEYSLGEDKSFVWLVSSNSIDSFELPKRRQIESSALRLYNLVVQRNRQVTSTAAVEWKHQILQADTAAESLAADLGQTLLGPLNSRLGQKRLVIVTEGTLQLVPFSSLLVPEQSSQVEKLVPLFVNHEIVGLPSFSILNVLRKNAARPVAPNTVAIFADPVFSQDDPRLLVAVRINESAGEANNVSAVAGQRSVSGGNVANISPYRRLPGTRWEALQIASLLPKDQSFLALDFNANRETALSSALSNYRIIHFATHAFVDDTNPTLSRIVLSQFTSNGDAQNGSLTLTDVYRMKIKADLVVLSACKSALGVNTKGEGLVGLTGGFMHAGAPRVLVSLWAISDTAAAEFMAKFYRKLLGPEKLPPAAALRQVQIETWKDKRFQSPYYWAPYLYSGEWKWR
jgi:CHAT domain-containing protein/tetratricopeptide (TPR) repeat protein